MADKKPDPSTRFISLAAAMAATFVVRKVIAFAWTKITGKEPPTHPEDPRVGLREALGWSMLTGVTVEATRLLATRAVARKAGRSGGSSPRANSAHNGSRCEPSGGADS